MTATTTADDGAGNGNGNRGIGGNGIDPNNADGSSSDSSNSSAGTSIGVGVGVAAVLIVVLGAFIYHTYYSGTKPAGASGSAPSKPADSTAVTYPPTIALGSTPTLVDTRTTAESSFSIRPAASHSGSSVSGGGGGGDYREVRGTHGSNQNAVDYREGVDGTRQQQQQQQFRNGAGRGGVVGSTYANPSFVVQYDDVTDDVGGYGGMANALSSAGLDPLPAASSTARSNVLDVKGSNSSRLMRTNSFC